MCIGKYAYIMGYCPAIKKNETLSFATTWMDLEDMMLNKINQTEEEKCCTISPIYGI